MNLVFLKNGHDEIWKIELLGNMWLAFLIDGDLGWAAEGENPPLRYLTLLI